MDTTNFHQSQRGYFAGALLEEMKNNEKIYLLTGDLGYGALDKIRDTFPARFINCGASEQAMLGVAVGLAQERKIPFVYTISSFFMRAAETVILYLHNEFCPVRLIGSGRDDDYLHDGPSHFAYQTQDFIKRLGIVDHYPLLKEDVPDIVKNMVESNVPSYLSLKR